MPPLAPGSNGCSAASFKEALDRLVDAHKCEVDELREELSKAREALAHLGSEISPPPIIDDARDRHSTSTQDADEKDIPGVVVDSSSARSNCALPVTPSQRSARGQERLDSVVPRASENSSPSPSSYEEASVRAGSKGRSVTSPDTEIGTSLYPTASMRWKMQNDIGKKPSFDRKSTTSFERLERSFGNRVNDFVYARNRQRRVMYKVVESLYFKVVSYTLIVSNATFIGASMHHHLRCAILSECPESGTWWDSMELAFDIAFTIELMLKFMAWDVLMFVGNDWAWNCLDFFLVASALVNRAAEASLPKITVTRIVRLFRVTRILRVIRVIKICQSLRVMIFAILKSLDALMWVFAVLFFFNYMFAMVFMHATTEAFADRARSSEDHLSSLEEFFGGLPQALITLFQSITNGRDWSEVFNSLSQVSNVYGAFFIGYVYFTVFLVMNVVIGTVVDVTSHESHSDRDRVVREEFNKVKDYTQNIQQFFEQADTDRSGSLTWDKLERYLEDDMKKAHFQSLDLDLSQAHVLFDLLDDDGNGEVGIHQFVDGCLRLKGQARSIDMHLAIRQLEGLMRSLSSGLAGGPKRPGIAVAAARGR